MRRRKAVWRHIQTRWFSSEHEKAFFRGEPESVACQRSASSSEGEFRARLQWRMNEPIDRSLCGGTVHEYRALTGATGTDGNQDEKARGEAEGLHCGGGDGGARRKLR